MFSFWGCGLSKVWWPFIGFWRQSIVFGQSFKAASKEAFPWKNIDPIPFPHFLSVSFPLSIHVSHCRSVWRSILNEKKIKPRNHNENCRSVEKKAKKNELESIREKTPTPRFHFDRCNISLSQKFEFLAACRFPDRKSKLASLSSEPLFLSFQQHFFLLTLVHFANFGNGKRKGDTGKKKKLFSETLSTFQVKLAGWRTEVTKLYQFVRYWEKMYRKPIIYSIEERGKIANCESGKHTRAGIQFSSFRF